MKGVIFDWDGVVIDSSAKHERSWEILSEEISRPLPEGHFKRGFGKKNEVIIPEILGWAKDLAEISKLAERKETIYRELVRDRGVQILPGARELLAALRSEKTPRAIGSSTPRQNLEAIFSVTGLGEFSMRWSVKMMSQTASPRRMFSCLPPKCSPWLLRIAS